MSNEIKEDEIIEEQLYSKDIFDEEIALINNEINVIDDLYNEVKIHYDKVKNSISRGSLTFLEKQTSNLINLKTAKLNYIKERASMKKTTVDFGFKDKQIKAHEGTATDAISEAIYKKITEDFAYNNKSLQQSLTMTNDVIDDNDIDDELDAILEENGIDIEGIVDESEVNVINAMDEEIEEDEIEIEEDSDLSIVVDENGKFYKVNSNYDLIEELGELEKIVEQDEDTAIGESGEVYEIIMLV